MPEQVSHPGPSGAPQPASPPGAMPLAGVSKDLWLAAWRFRGRTLAAVVLLVLAKVASVCVPLVFKKIIDLFSVPGSLLSEVVPGTSMQAPAGGRLIMVPLLLLAGYALLRFSSTLFTELRDLCFARVTLVTVADFAQRALAQLHRLGPRFHLQVQTGALMRDVERGTVGAGFLLGAVLFTLVPTMVEIVAVVSIMAAGYSVWFTAIIATTFTVYACYTAVMTRRRVALQSRVNELDSRANGLLLDSLVNQEAVRNNGRERGEVQRYEATRAEWVERSVESHRALSALHLGQGAIIALGVGAIMLFAGLEAIHGRITVGDLVLVNTYVIQICLPLNALGFLFREARDALTNLDRLQQILALQPEVQEAPHAAQLPVTHGEVVFEHVDFSYEPGRQVLWDVNLRIAPGQTVALVGGSGSGKSTLARLLLRVYDPQRGRVLVDGTDIRMVSLASLRAAVGIVPQDSTLFNETVAYNIAYGRPGASISEVVQAARAAQIDELIASLGQQFDTKVGERGLKLSGGEKQRIAIARAFLRNAPIMVLDEATSALDTRSEKAIQVQLDRLSSQRTTLVIAHRLSTIVQADLIVVMDKGRIVEQGRHEQLLTLRGLYAQLWELQLQKQEFDRLERRLVRQSLNLGVLLASVVDGLRAALDSRSIQLYTHIEPEPLRVMGDPGVLSQALWDICAHAMDATPHGGRIQLRLERDGRRARLALTDGRHMTHASLLSAASGAPDDMALLGASQPETRGAFDPLVVRSAIQRQGGQLEIFPPTSMQGMRFVVMLPLQDGTEDALRTGATSQAAVDGAPAQLPQVEVMLIDDSAPARAAFEQLMERHGALAHVFASGEEGLHWLESLPVSQWPVVMVCDSSLGNEDGRQVLSRIRALEERRGVALARRMSAIALTNSAHPSEQLVALMSGFQAQLARTAPPAELVHTIARLARPED